MENLGLINGRKRFFVCYKLDVEFWMSFVGWGVRVRMVGDGGQFL